MQPDEPDREERLEQLSEDNETPFRPATAPRNDVADQSEEREAEGVILDDTHPVTDTNIQPEELYDEGVSGAAEAGEPNAGNTVVEYRKSDSDVDKVERS